MRTARATFSLDSLKVRLALASAVLILAPLYVARWAFVQYGEEQRAHERTLSALVTAVEIGRASCRERVCYVV